MYNEKYLVIDVRYGKMFKIKVVGDKRGHVVVAMALTLDDIFKVI